MHGLGIVTSMVVKRDCSLLVRQVPFCEADTARIIFFATFCEPSDALGNGLPICVVQGLNALVHLNAENNPLLLEKFGYGFTAG